MNYIIPIIPIIAGFLLDAILGDPYSLPHPIRLIGRLISALEKFVRRHFRCLTAGGVFLALTVLLLSAGAAGALLYICCSAELWLGVAVESVICYYMLAAKSLRKARDICQNDGIMV